MMVNFGPLSAGSQPRKKGLLQNKLLLALIVIIVIGVIVMIAYFDIELNSALAAARPINHGPLPKSSLGISLLDQELLTYSNIRAYIPYALISYVNHNVTQININATMLKAHAASENLHT